MVSMCQFCITEKYQILEIQDDERRLEVWKPEDIQEEEALDPNSSCGRLFHRSLFKQIRFPVGKLHEDRFITYRLLFQFEKVAVVNVPLYYYFMNAEGIVHSNWSLRKLDDLEATEQQLEYFKKNGFIKTYIFTLRDYIHLLVYSLRNMRGKKEYKKAYVEVRKKLRNVLKKHYQLLGMSFDKDFNTYKYAYPVAAKIYRRLKSLKKK